jgi:hypothetical protein
LTAFGRYLIWNFGEIIIVEVVLHEKEEISSSPAVTLRLTTILANFEIRPCAERDTPTEIDEQQRRQSRFDREVPIIIHPTR